MASLRKRGKTYYAQFYVGATQKRVSLGTSSYQIAISGRTSKWALSALTLVVGNVLAIYKTGEIVRDRVRNERVQLPAERAGLLMVFRVYNKMSYGIVLQASRQMAILDEIRNP